MSWSCSVCGSQKQPTTKVPSFRNDNVWYERPIRNAKACSNPVCQHEHRRRKAKALKAHRGGTADTADLGSAA